LPDKLRILLLLHRTVQRLLHFYQIAGTHFNFCLGYVAERKAVISFLAEANNGYGYKQGRDDLLHRKLLGLMENALLKVILKN